ncbi:hypothetical protein NFI96_019820, partial [Prochilodus magdalenae]
VRHELPSVRHELPSVRHELPSIQYELLSIQYELPSIPYELPSIPYELPSIQYELPSIQYELPKAVDAPVRQETDNRTCRRQTRNKYTITAGSCSRSAALRWNNINTATENPCHNSSSPASDRETDFTALMSVTTSCQATGLPKARSRMPTLVEEHIRTRSDGGKCAMATQTHRKAGFGRVLWFGETSLAY